MRMWPPTIWPKTSRRWPGTAGLSLIGSGTAKAPEAAFMVGPALFKDAAIYGMALGNSATHIPELARSLVALFASGQLKAVVHQTYPLAQAQRALGDLVASRVFGKLVLVQ